ncbi:Dam family site-specific DNA-(adenine-N6)-methyltransferase [Psychrosphaera sp. B3R10]|uniref:Dam family site-specific DNA-(adenine-N6)-methyltransferase n=1 Tax=unclassified Psychrosphaera TaxID=2641570 RepID=UPI001C09DE31|nr:MULTISPECIES: Dam family site-specific DNA-(adenine-N6)-methyltransferase [unclassified Psychrosphaera]MBU2881087.1 Dam family site-specific DNA-(adenine-N6)-methyltransferase [Psychrosphaera sp. I2R16]MBU2990011.1 Dam family site-specific DNA-(adenine-N6)-methyltransferase [Psychrosphaera sp. B3R10]MDO6721206.1 Dam family site-specific DNA-(adenine-N6)-methyltransferase [Psychrosphaera sp. 1_MG-2023]
MTKKTRAFLKWAGGKYSLIEQIHSRLPEGKKLVEPFVGAGSVFLNSNYDSYLLNDVNPDLIRLYKYVKSRPKTLVTDARTLFNQKNNDKVMYYGLRQEFNTTTDLYYRALLFIYLNRHGYNGLCRYNLKGGFNVPFGDYNKPYFPENEIYAFSEKAKKAKFVCEDYKKTFSRARAGSVIYCDPPYAPLSQTAKFTSYSVGGFDPNEQAKLALLAEHTAFNRKIPVLISNHDTELTRKLYHEAKHSFVKVSRNISQNGATRKKVGEIFAYYCPDKVIVKSR